jgi:DNA-binding NtrC family response regulator
VGKVMVVDDAVSELKIIEGDYLAKPFTADQLLDVVRQFVK